MAAFVRIPAATPDTAETYHSPSRCDAIAGGAQRERRRAGSIKAALGESNGAQGVGVLTLVVGPEHGQIHSVRFTIGQAE
jgi:hypothetical protein